MNKKVSMGVKSWTETPEMIMEKINKAFPELGNRYDVERPVLSHINDPKPPYQLGFVAKLKHKGWSSDVGCIIYYPFKGSCVRYYSQRSTYPVNGDWKRLYSTKRGDMKVTTLNGEAVVVFSKQFNEVK
ncbi:MAG: hypothetical protein IKL33_04220 [Alphaproteobacteria bacterium]|nr:hypothetical protein [Alphaproteobacteria bacterium]